MAKPFEFTKFSDLPQKGYDPEKIAYYENYEILKEKTLDGATCEDHYHCVIIIRILIYIFKNNIGYEKPILKHGCCKIFLDEEDFNTAFPKSDLDISITNMLKKLHEFEETPDNNYNIINDENKESMRNIGYDITPASDDTLQEIKYDILKNN